jgi:hypothetical protein
MAGVSAGVHIFFDDKMFPWTMDSRLWDGWMDLGYRQSVFHNAAYLQIPLFMLPIGSAGRFVYSIVWQVPALLHPQ